MLVMDNPGEWMIGKPEQRGAAAAGSKQPQAKE